MTEDESGLYERIASITKRPTESLSSKWREPSFTVHNIQVSGPRSMLVTFLGSWIRVLNPTRSNRDSFPSEVSSIGTDSTRPEPRYHRRELVRVLEGIILRVEIPKFNRGNAFGLCLSCDLSFITTSKVKIDHAADWWLGRLDDEWFGFLETSVREEWGVTPLRIREGGVSIIIFRCTRLTVEFRGVVHPVGSIPRKRVRLSCFASPSRPEFCERDIASLCTLICSKYFVGRTRHIFQMSEYRC